ncbi:MAG: hypothetical protein UU94_C0005G0001 [Candidatus Collierbacteria bacterium GW2011_GWB2_42_12]|nr:MAG: hypothetical protein UU94_C0005G0001 [Candidatus Collierbacteria bacterium GW2011_GWB2_42_12]
MQHTPNNEIRYIATREKEFPWNLNVNTVGFESISAHSSYPASGHPQGYSFDFKRGRILKKFQLVYITKGKGQFAAMNNMVCQITEGSLFFLSPGEWHTYKPDESTGWESYWVGFDGAFAQDLLKHKSAYIANPVVNIGYDEEIVSLYKKLLEVSISERPGYQNLLSGIVIHLLSYLIYREKNKNLNDKEIFNKIDHNKVNIVITPVKALADKIFSVTDYFPKLFPVPFASMQFPIKYNADSIKIGFFGDGRKEKGILDFMRFVDVSKNNERYNFTVQIQNPRGFSDEEKAELNNLINKIEVNENVTILRGPLPSSEYYKNLCNCDIVCILHDPKHYSIRLSGIAVECGILGIPVIVRIGSSAGNWISEEKLFGELIHNDDFDGPIKRLHSKILEVENVRKVNKLSEKWKSEYSAENYFNNYLLPLITE